MGMAQRTAGNGTAAGNTGATAGCPWETQWPVMMQQPMIQQTKTVHGPYNSPEMVARPATIPQVLTNSNGDTAGYQTVSNDRAVVGTVGQEVTVEQLETVASVALTISSLGWHGGW